jgi:rhodanese-related sulfurtransferase
MPIEQTTPDKAKEILDNDPDAIYLDVRSMAEFVAGHAEGAINIPLMHRNEESGELEPNTDFAKVAQAALDPSKTLLIGCHAGGRSQKACSLLAILGFEKLYNIDGGFGGNERQPGWQALGLPVSQENGEGISYESLAGP